MIAESFTGILTSLPPLVWLVLGLGGLVAIFAPTLPKRSGRRGRRAAAPSLLDPRVQLAAVKAVDFEVQPLFNTAEAKVFSLLEQIIADQDGSLRVMGQINMGEILSPGPGSSSAKAKQAREDARRSINSKRIDFGVFTAQHQLVLAIEYQGGGHFRGSARTRDAVKKAAFDAAGIPLLAIFPNHSAADIRAEVIEHLAAQPLD